jgi:hypothetical protein
MDTRPMHMALTVVIIPKIEALIKCTVVKKRSTAAKTTTQK